MNPKQWFVMFGGFPVGKGSQAQAENVKRLELIQALNSGSTSPEAGPTVESGKALHDE